MFKVIVDFLKYLFEEKKKYYGYSDYGKFGEVYDKSKAVYYQHTETETIHKANNY